MRYSSLLSALLLLPSPSPAQKADDDVKALQGAWRGYVVEGKGENASEGPVHLEIVVKGDTITAKKLAGKGESPLGDGAFRLAVSDKVKTIDATRTSMPGKGQVYLGIYALEGNTLKWCSATPKNERPREMLSKRGQFLLILKKQ